MWIVGFALLVVWGISFLYLYKDALDGYHEVLPCLSVCRSWTACLAVWGYIASKLV